MIHLYQFPAPPHFPNFSPFCMKLETYLRMSHLQFTVHSMRNPSHAPKGKLPFIKEEGEVIADSNLIINYLKAKHGDLLDQNLTTAQRAQNLALLRLIEEHLYWTIMYSRWADESGWPVVKALFFSGVPTWLRPWITRSVRRQMLKTLYLQGIGRHSRDEIYEFGKSDIDVIAATLGHQAFINGDTPTSLDACVYGFIANILAFPAINPLQSYCLKQTNLVDYCARMKQRFYDQ